MIIFTVHEPPDPPADRLDRAEKLVFVKDGFTYVALAATPIWLLAKQQWIAFVVYLVVYGGMVSVFLVTEAPLGWLWIASAALHIMVGYEADSIQRWTLRRNGYRMISTVTGQSRIDCERRFLEAWLPRQPVITASAGMSGPGTLAATAGPIPRATQAMGGAGRRWFSPLRGS